MLHTCSEEPPRDAVGQTSLRAHQSKLDSHLPGKLPALGCLKFAPLLTVKEGFILHQQKTWLWGTRH